MFFFKELDFPGCVQLLKNIISAMFSLQTIGNSLFADCKKT